MSGSFAWLQKLVAKKMVDSNFDYYHIIYNLGVSGDTTEKLLQRCACSDYTTLLIDGVHLNGAGYERIYLIFTTTFNEVR